MTTRYCLFLSFLFVPVFCGCGGGQESSVTGTVTLDGQPLAGANVSFIPADRGPLAYASTDANGNYEVKTGQQTGLPPGKYKVTVIATKMPEYDPNSLEEPIAVRTSPEIYASAATTPFEFDVAAGVNDFPLKLVSQ